MNNIALQVDTLEDFLKQAIRSVLRESEHQKWDERFSAKEQKQLHSIKLKMKARKPLAEDELQLAAHAGLIPRSQSFVWRAEFLDSLKRSELQLKKGSTKHAASVEELSPLLQIED